MNEKSGAAAGDLRGCSVLLATRRWFAGQAFGALDHRRSEWRLAMPCIAPAVWPARAVTSSGLRCQQAVERLSPLSAQQLLGPFANYGACGWD